MTTMGKVGAAALAVLLIFTAAAPAVEKEAIDKAVEGGVRALRQAQGADGKWTGFSHDLGMTALGALTLLECNSDTTDPAIKLAAKYVREKSINETRTYSIALAIIFLDRLGDPVDIALIESLTVRLLAGQRPDGGWSYDCPGPSREELDRLAKQVKDSSELKGRRTLPSPEDNKRTTKDLAPEIQQQLKGLDGQGPVQPMPNMMVMSDNSNTQFATVALWIAKRQGLPIEPALGRVDKHFRSLQNRDGGWPYVSTGTVATESTATMTGAGVLCLAIVDGAVNDANRARNAKAPGVDAKKDPNLTKGLVALAAVIDHSAEAKQARGLPAKIPQVSGKTFYFLWTLERVCVALDLQTLAGKDWYNWATEIIVANQQTDGSWKGDYPIADTCFALLVLRRANLASDLTSTLKGKITDETKSKPGVSTETHPGTVKPGLEEKKAPPPLDEKTEQGKLAKEIVQASGTKQELLIEKYRDTKGVAYTEALVTAIGNLSGEAQNKARDALAERLARMTPKTLTSYLKDDEPEIRRAAALACALKESKAHIPDLIELLRDKDAGVAHDALRALKDLSGGQKFGPSPNATADERDKAIAAWQEWWKKQQK